MLYRITYQTGIGNQNWTELDASSENEARSEFNRSWFGGSVTILTVKQVGGKAFEQSPMWQLPENNPDAGLIKTGDRVVCIYNELSSLTLGREYIVVKEAGPAHHGNGAAYDVFVQDTVTGERDIQSRSRKRFKIVRANKRKGLAPGLTLIDLRGRKGVAPNLKLN